MLSGWVPAPLFVCLPLGVLVFAAIRFVLLYQPDIRSVVIIIIIIFNISATLQ